MHYRQTCCGSIDTGDLDCRVVACATKDRGHGVVELQSGAMKANSREELLFCRIRSR